MRSIKLTDNLHIRNLKKDYLKKKSQIKKRLEEFERFYNEKVCWNFSEGKMNLKPSKNEDDARIFEELCFCILTANTSAEMGMRSIDKIRNLLISGTKEEMKESLEGIYRFKNLRPMYIVETREKLKEKIGFKIKDKIEKTIQFYELRDFFVENVKGLGYKEASHFLRNIGMKGYAILDKHILNSLIELKVLDEVKMPLNKERYENIERKMRMFSNEIKIGMDELDLLLWSGKNGKILK
ncbi:N-glycosylase/DNA lyase [Candidatus Woesearchaeota archaeon]|nr:N-glycosylase/DNA lyase [Candidatus Woesearchaeota archaeon]